MMFKSIKSFNEHLFVDFFFFRKEEHALKGWKRILESRCIKINYFPTEKSLHIFVFILSECLLRYLPAGKSSTHCYHVRTMHL